MISGFTGSIFTKFSPHGRYLIVDYRSDTFFFDDSRDVAMATNFRVKIGKIGLFTFIRSPDIRHSDFLKFMCDDLATLCKNLVNFGIVTPEFKRGKDIHPSSVSSLATFAWLRHC